MARLEPIHHIDTGYIKLMDYSKEEPVKGKSPAITVCKIEYLHDFDGNFQCEMTPFWDVIKNPPEPWKTLEGGFIEIAGIDEKRFREVYRFPPNVDPAFVYRHMPTRGSHYALLECAKVGLTSFEPIEYMIREPKRYDYFIVERDP
jgi:hypothetical protein